MYACGAIHMVSAWISHNWWPQNVFNVNRANLYVIIYLGKCTRFNYILQCKMCYISTWLSLVYFVNNIAVLNGYIHKCLWFHIVIQFSGGLIQALSILLHCWLQWLYNCNNCLLFQWSLSHLDPFIQIPGYQNWLLCLSNDCPIRVVE